MAKRGLATLLADYEQQGLGGDLDGGDEDSGLLTKLGLSSRQLPSQASNAAPTQSLAKHKQQLSNSKRPPAPGHASPKSSKKAKPKKPGTQQQAKAKSGPSPASQTIIPAPDNTTTPDGSWPFEVEYKDHFETGQEALEHLQPALQWLASKHPSGSRRPEDLVIYDPYYCKGGVVKHWKALGYNKVIHRNRDFYADIDSGQVPDYDILVTNPPYSADHKERILSFCRASGKPWALLMPNYVSNKTYFNHNNDTTTTAQQQHKHKKGNKQSQRSFFIVPPQKYEFKHPQGTGHESSPFFSIWFVFLGDRTAEACMQLQQGQPSPKHSAEGGQAATVVTSVDQLRQQGATPSWKRPNPKQRKKLKQMQSKT